MTKFRNEEAMGYEANHNALKMLYFNKLGQHREQKLARGNGGKVPGGKA